MKTLGEILKKARLRKKLSLAKIAAMTKIKQEHLLALEENRYQDLPSATYVRGFIKNYSQVLNMEPRSLLAIFRRDYQEKTKPVFRPFNVRNFSWTPKLTFAFLLFLALIFFFGYLFWQYRLLLRSPYRL